MQYQVFFQYQLLHFSSVLDAKCSQVGKMYPVSMATQNTQSQKTFTCTAFAAVWQIWTCDDVTIIFTEINKILSVPYLIAWHVLYRSSASPESVVPWCQNQKLVFHEFCVHVQTMKHGVLPACTSHWWFNKIPKFTTYVLLLIFSISSCGRSRVCHLQCSIWCGARW